MMQNETLSGSGNVEPESGPAIKKSSTFLVTKCSVILFVPLFLVKHPLTFYITETLLLLTHIVTSCRLAYRINRNL